MRFPRVRFVSVAIVHALGALWAFVLHREGDRRRHFLRLAMLGATTKERSSMLLDELRAMAEAEAAVPGQEGLERFAEDLTVRLYKPLVVVLARTREEARQRARAEKILRDMEVDEVIH